MSITDEDMVFMSGAIWKDLSPAPPSEAPEEGDIASSAPASSESSGESAAAKKIEWKRPAKPKANGSLSGSAAQENPALRDMLRAPKSTSPLIDLDDSPPDTSIQPRKARKLSKSMRGASQNDKPGRLSAQSKKNGPVAATVTTAADPYGLPISPTSSRQQQDGTSFENVLQGLTPADNAKPPSPLGLGTKSDKKRAKQQKRVAKRSFLDPPETPEQGAKVEQPQPKPALKVPAAPAVKQQPKQQKKPRAKKPSKPKETIVRPPPIRQAETQNGNIAKKLRPRGERAPIIISSDSESSYEEDDDFSDAGYAPDTSLSSLTSPEEHFAVKEPIQLPVQKPVQKPVEKSAEKSVEKTSEKAAQRDRQQQVLPNVRPKNPPIIANGAKIKKEPAEAADTRGRNSYEVKTQPSQNENAHHKRHRSPNGVQQNGQGRKKQKYGQNRTTAQVQEVAHPLPSEIRRASTTVLQQAPVNDPFVENGDENGSVQTQFTTKLWQSAAQPQPTREALEQESRVRQMPEGRARLGLASSQPRDHVKDQMRGQVRDQMKDHVRDQVRDAASDGIARQMMQLLADGASGQSERHKNGGHESAKEIWLEETDPYKETGEIMGYVCKTLLRFLKSKEAAVGDVADEYHHRGTAVVSRIEKLHGKELCGLVRRFEDERLRSLEIYEAAYRDVHLLAAKLQRVNLLPAVNDAFEDSAGSRLRALQAEMA